MRAIAVSAVVVLLLGDWPGLAEQAVQPATERGPGETAAGAEADEAPSKLLVKATLDEPLTIVAFGDSITYGQGVTDATVETYPAVWARGLKEYFGPERIRLVNLSDPGVLSWYAVNYIESHVAAHKPDLVLLQFGGNDSREKTDLNTFTWALTQMVVRLRATADPEIVLVVPPMLDKPEDKQIIDAIWRIGKKQRVAVADFDRALKQAETDHRGLFPFGGHPNAYSHRIMAQELNRVCAPLLGLDCPLSLELHDQSWVLGPGQPATFAAEISNQSDVEQQAKVKLDLLPPWGASHEQEVLLAAGQSKRVELSLEPPKLPGRSAQFLLWGYAPSANGFAFGQKWATFAPVIGLGVPPVADAGAELVPTLCLGAESIRLGRDEWEDDADLSAEVSLSRTTGGIDGRGGKLRIAVRVHDDQLVRNFHKEVPENDCVELFFDTRPEADQGKLYFTREVFVLFVKPPTPAAPEPELVPLSQLPRKAETPTVEGKLEDDGYSLQIDVPLSAFTSGGAPLPRFGFDIALDDTDNPGWRQTQMIWAGLTSNFLNPSAYGVVQLEGEVQPGVRRLTVR